MTNASPDVSMLEITWLTINKKQRILERNKNTFQIAKPLFSSVNQSVLQFHVFQQPWISEWLGLWIFDNFDIHEECTIFLCFFFF